jgi:hypothetical protein
MKTSRRDFLKYTAGLPLLVLPLPVAVHANPSAIHAVRFIGGIIYDIAIGVVADLIADEIRGNGYDSRTMAQESYRHYRNLPGNETAFNHPVYKRSVVRLGLSEGQPHPTRQIALNLRDPAQLERFGKLRDYLIQNKIRAKLADYEYSHKVSTDTPPDDLFTLDYLDMGDHQERHYQEIIALTGNTVFKQLSG